MRAVPCLLILALASCSEGPAQAPADPPRGAAQGAPAAPGPTADGAFRLELRAEAPADLYEAFVEGQLAAYAGWREELGAMTPAEREVAGVVLADFEDPNAETFEVIWQNFFDYRVLDAEGRDVAGDGGRWVSPGVFEYEGELTLLRVRVSCEHDHWKKDPPVELEVHPAPGETRQVEVAFVRGAPPEDQRR